MSGGVEHVKEYEEAKALAELESLLAELCEEIGRGTTTARVEA